MAKIHSDSVGVLTHPEVCDVIPDHAESADSGDAHWQVLQLLADAGDIDINCINIVQQQMDAVITFWNFKMT